MNSLQKILRFNWFNVVIGVSNDKKNWWWWWWDGVIVDGGGGGGGANAVGIGVGIEQQCIIQTMYIYLLTIDT